MFRRGFSIAMALLAVASARADITAIVNDCEGCPGPKGERLAKLSPADVEALNHFYGSPQ